MLAIGGNMISKSPTVSSFLRGELSWNFLDI